MASLAPYAIATLAPADDSASATALPMPPLPPVTRATRPVRLMSGGCVAVRTVRNASPTPCRILRRPASRPFREPVWPEMAISLRARRGAVILSAVIGAGFGDTLTAAQEGDEEAFTRLWLDGNAALLRYLRATAPEAAEDIAADTWVHVVRGLSRFRGDEAAWRAWLFTTARRRTIDQAR